MRSSTFGSTICFRLKARSWRVRPEARCVAFRICSSLPRCASPAWRIRSSVYPRMTPSELLKSWATPPARRPTASIFWDCRSCSSRRRRSLASRMRASIRPSAITVASTSASNFEPSLRRNCHSWRWSTPWLISVRAASHARGLLGGEDVLGLHPDELVARVPEHGQAGGIHVDVPCLARRRPGSRRARFRRDSDSAPRSRAGLAPSASAR